MNNDDTVAQCPHIEEIRQSIEESVIDGLYLFKIKELRSLYANRLTELGIGKVLKTLLKQNILDHFRITHLKMLETV